MTQHVRDALDDQGRPPAHLRCEVCRGYGRIGWMSCYECNGSGLHMRRLMPSTAGARPRTALADVRGDNGASEGGVA